MRVLPLSGLSTRRLIICSKRGNTRHTPKQISCSKGKSWAFTESCTSGINADKDLPSSNTCKIKFAAIALVESAVIFTEFFALIVLEENFFIMQAPYQ